MTRTGLLITVAAVLSGAGSAVGQVAVPVSHGGMYVPQGDFHAGQVGMPGIEYSTSIAAGDGGQLYPYDRQDPWLHGQFQRVPAYGGFASFRPYNYRHVMSQTQLATAWGLPHGMPYSQQFWNKYRSSYMQGNLHSMAQPGPATTMPRTAGGFPATAASYPVQLPTQSVQSWTVPQASTQQQPRQQQQQPPIHVYPQR